MTSRAPVPPAADAGRVIEIREPLVIGRALTTTGINLELVESGLTVSDGVKGDYIRKTRGGKAEVSNWDHAKSPEDRVRMFADNPQAPPFL